MKLGFSYKFLFYLLLIVVLAYIALKYFNVIEGNKRHSERQQERRENILEAQETGAKQHFDIFNTTNGQNLFNAVFK